MNKKIDIKNESWEGAEKMRKVVEKKMRWLAVLFFALIISFIPAVKGNAANYSLALNNSWRDGKIVTRDDMDVYNFSINKAGTVKITYQGWSIRDSYVQILDGDQVVEFEKNNIYTSSETDPKTKEYELALEPGSYCVKVWGYGDNVGNYRLKGSFTSAGNTENEPNNTFASAMKLESGSAGLVKGFISRTDTIDFYKIYVPSDQKIKITYTAKIPDSYCEIWNQDQFSLNKKNVYTASEENPKTYVYEESLKAGTYYIKITPYGSHTGRYTLMWETEQQIAYVTSIKITGNKTMKPGTYMYLSTSITPSNATDQTVTWASSDTSVATIDENGRVYARKAGKTIITAVAKDGSNVRETCTVTVKNTVQTSTKRVTGIKISGNKKVAAGQKFKLKAVVSPANATNKNVAWTSGNKKIATVSFKGVVTAKLPGKTTILAKAKDGSGVNKKITVIVLPKKMATPKVSSSNGKVRVSYGKQSGVSGYQVEGSSKKNFSNYQMNTVGKNKKAVTITGLAKGKYYYTRVRSYVKIGSKTYYGKWSSVKKVKVQ